MNSKRWSLIGVIYFIQLECFSSWLSLQFDVFYTRCGKKIKWFSYLIWKTTFMWVFEPILWVCWMNVVRIEMERYHYEITLLNISLTENTKYNWRRKQPETQTFVSVQEAEIYYRKELRKESILEVITLSTYNIFVCCKNLFLDRATK